MPNSPVVTIQLLLVRSLFDRAVLAAQEHSDIGNMSAMLLADVAVETLIKNALVEKQVPFDRDDTLNKLLPKLGDLVPSAQPGKVRALAKRLRDARNPVQHSAMIPSPTSVAAHLRDAESFITIVLKEAFGIEFKKVTAAALVQSPDLRAALDEANKLIADGDADKAAVYVVGAFESFRIRWGQWLRYGLGKNMAVDGIIPALISEPAMAVFGPEHPYVHEPETITGAWRDLARTMLGLSSMDLARLRRLHDRALVVLHAHEAESAPEGEPPDPNVVVMSIEALARSIWRMEALHPELLEPGVGPASAGASADDEDASSES